MVILIIFICAVALTYLLLEEDEEEKSSAPKCSNCANCTKNKNQDNIYPYCSRRDMFLMNTEKSAEDCVFYEVKGLNLSFKSFFAIMLVVTIILGVY